MFIRLLARAFALAALLLCFNQANAQTDSAYFNLGRVKLLKSATQHVTVKASDLQKFPFANLADAINVWFSGYFTSANSLIYVIDGNLATDVNQYPIYDIDEITLVQNAVTQLNGSSQQQQFIVVTTKRNRQGNSGVLVAAQANLVKLQKNRLGSSAVAGADEAFYQQYHISAFKNVDQLHFGVSANYLQDAIPAANAANRTDLANPQIKRWRINGYLNTALGNSSVLDITAGYAPQSNERQFRVSTPGATQARINNDEDLFNGSLNLYSKLLPGLTNELRATYNNYTINSNGSFSTIVPNGPGTNTYLSTSTTESNLKNILIYDELRYSKTSGNFTFSPALNFNFRNVKNAVSGGNNNSSGSVSQSTSGFKLKTYLLTPTFTLNYTNNVSVTAGLVQILNNSKAAAEKSKKTFPFVTASANVSRLIDTTAPVIVKIFGSYATSNRFNDSQSALSSLNPYGVLGTSDQFTNNSGLFDYIDGKRFKTLSLGLTAGLFNNKLELSYNYENRDGFTLISYLITGNQPYIYSYLSDTKYKFHRVGVGFDLFKNNNLQWKTQINTTNLKQQTKSTPSGNLIASVSLFDKAWTGGWTNRLQYKKLVAGIDVQYILGKSSVSQIQFDDLESFSLQNLYIGWQLKTAKTKTLEVFANARNLTQNKNSVLTDYRRYLGLGIQATF